MFAALNISMPVCPHCKIYRLSFKDAFYLSPHSPGICPECEKPYLGTYFSLFIRVGLSIFIPVFSNSYFNLSLSTENIAFLTMPSYLLSCGIEALITLPKKHKFVDREWFLPKSRLVGYTIYLITPVCLMFGLLILAARYEVGF